MKNILQHFHSTEGIVEKLITNNSRIYSDIEQVVRKMASGLRNDC